MYLFSFFKLGKHALKAFMSLNKSDTLPLCFNKAFSANFFNSLSILPRAACCSRRVSGIQTLQGPFIFYTPGVVVQAPAWGRSHSPSSSISFRGRSIFALIRIKVLCHQDEFTCQIKIKRLHLMNIIEEVIVILAIGCHRYPIHLFL